MTDIRKFFPSSGTQAVDGACLRARDGSIHALVGENGAGKTTLMRILYGLERADSGKIEVDGREARITGTADARALGIGMVQQHFTTVDDFTVAENIALGGEPRAFGLFYGRREAEARAARTLRAHGFALDPRAKAGTLPVGGRQLLEIAKLLHRDARILILDEPTAVLAEREIDALFDTLRALRDSGRTVILITHKVREVMRIADQVSVMRAGKTTDTLPISETGEDDLSCRIMGVSACPSPGGHTPSRARGDTVLRAEALVAARADGRGNALSGIGFQVKAGEILGICALAGNGLYELEDILGGFAVPDSGTLTLCGEPWPKLRRPASSGNGLGYVPSDRMRRGVALALPVQHNLIALDRAEFHPRGIFAARKARSRATAALAAFSVRADPGQEAASLSGGTVQKLMLARELTDPPPGMLVLCDPTWGLDIVSTNATYDAIARARDSGAAIALLSSNLDEIMELSDRIMVLHRGKIAYHRPNDGSATPALLGDYMLGVKSEAADD